MARNVPAVERALDVLELLAARPGEALSLSEIARRLNLNKASGHAIVTLLSDRGYLIRDHEKSYSLGPSLLPLATTYLDEHDALSHARAEMNMLSRELELDCVASTVVGDEIVVLARVNSPASVGVHVRAGSRFPLVPPVGTVFVAWAGQEGIRRWLAAVVPSASGPDQARYLEALARVRERGYAVGGGRRRNHETGTATPPAFEEDLLAGLESAQRFPIIHIAAPVLDPQGTVRLALTLVGFPEQIQAADIPRLGCRLLAVTTAVSRATWGTSETPAWAV
ncbi:IclR family transcriptional regulator [Parafrankia sp. FMc2]|uniref:IclR family transcriptional regulator n=1 Tax=Parafrankia sp. FMc2 TaxID=3233196 RepID=UPI0034D5A0D7